MQGKVAVLGSADFCMPFSALGLDTYPVAEDAENAVEKAQAILGAQYTLVVVAENVAPAAEPVFATVQNNPAPCVVIVPFTTPSSGFATEALSSILKMATGINILQDA